MTTTERFAQVHRFHGYVAAYLGDGSTVYMELEEARRFAEALNACARDVQEFPDFLDSHFSTFEMGLLGDRP